MMTSDPLLRKYYPFSTFFFHFSVSFSASFLSLILSSVLNHFLQGFMTASLQTYAREHMEAIDNLSFEFSILSMPSEEIKDAPKDGVIVFGMYLEVGEVSFSSLFLFLFLLVVVLSFLPHRVPSFSSFLTYRSSIS